MHFLPLFVAGLCLYVTGAAKLPSGDPDGPNSPGQVPRESNEALNFSISGEPPAFTEVLTVVIPDLVQCAHRFIGSAFSLDGLAHLWSKDLTEHLTYDEEAGDIVPQTYTWLEARNECRKRCMDLVSIDTMSKFNAVTEHLENSGVPAIWTSGHLCDLKGCQNRAELRPLYTNGWFWTGLPKLVAPTDKVPAGFDFNPWSHTGHFNRSQPDQAELQLDGKREGCIALMDNAYNDGVKLHDVACYHKKQFVCEESPALVKYIEKKYEYELPDWHFAFANMTLL